jgi:heparanase 1
VHSRASSQNCSLVNCTSGGDKCADLAYFSTLLTSANGAIEEVTVHNYGLTGPSHGPPYVPHQCSLPNLLNPVLWEQDRADRPGMLTVLRNWRDAQRRSAPQARIVLSETATTGDGGCVNLSNTFAAGFFWVDQLGLTASEGYWKVYRQDLVGFSGINGASSYALAGPPGWVGDMAANHSSRLRRWPTGPLQANPDFFTSILWKRLVGHRVLWSSLGADAVRNRNLANDSGVRVYGACSADPATAGQVALAFLNPTAGAVVLAVPTAMAVAPRTIWLLSSGARDGRLDTQHMLLNGVALSNADAVRSGGMAGLAEAPASTVSLPAHTYGFAMFAVRQGDAPACEDSG